MTGGGETRAGISTDVLLDSAVDGEAIAFTVHEPEVIEEGRRYLLVPVPTEASVANAAAASQDGRKT